MVKKAFTLIELLVVIAIIAILAAILFPVFAQARNAAKTTAAISNARQLSIGMQLYIDDNDGYFHKRDSVNNPPAEKAGGLGFETIQGGDDWAFFYAPYLKSIEILDDPMSPAGVEKFKKNFYATRDESNPNTNYALGNWGYNYSGLTQDANLSARSQSEIEFSSEVFAFYSSYLLSFFPDFGPYKNEYASLLGNFGIARTCGPRFSGRPLPSKAESGFRHNGRSVVVFVDGHVKPQGWQKMLIRGGNQTVPWNLTWTGTDPCRLTPTPAECSNPCPPAFCGTGRCFDPATLK
jgi:prepilin-type N-terminal cleavage/methylation domain-containing protein/prepilin-type processing-associated H-X9-DG protein